MKSRSSVCYWGAKTVAAAVLIVFVLFAAGCATTDSDMPWNAPQSWEGSPYIPGMSSGNY